MTDLNIFEKAMGWRKRQMVTTQVVRNEIIKKIRNDTLEEVAKEFDKMKAFGNTSQSFATFVRDMKHE
jgi:3-methyladenine DNA glycosylase AlkD